MGFHVSLGECNTLIASRGGLEFPRWRRSLRERGVRTFAVAEVALRRTFRSSQYCSLLTLLIETITDIMAIMMFGPF